LAYWTPSDVRNYIKKHKLPYNKLHDEGYMSIGDVVNTKTVNEDTSERSGRYVGLATGESGMHTPRTKILEK
jgi:phosphoadenosine phosphosulfate reductase